jgi:hypothetical protein
MAGDTAALVVALSAQLTKFEKDMKKAYEIADKGVADIEERFSKVNVSVGIKGGEGLEALISGLKTLAGAGGLAAIISQVTSLNEQVAKIGESASRVGLTTDQFQKLRFAFVATGSSVEAAESFIDTFSRKVTEAAQGTGALYNFLHANNIEARQFAKLPINEQIGRYADLVKNASTNNQIFISSLVSSRQAAAGVTDALKDGREGLVALGDQAEATGVLLDRGFVQRAQKANKEFQILKLQATTFLQEAALAASEQFKKQSQQNVENNKQLIDGWNRFLEVVKTTFPGLVDYLKEGFKDVGQSIEDAAKLRGVATQQSNFARGVELLKGGQGTQLTQKQMGEFPGYQAAKTTNEDLTKIYNEQQATFQKLIDQQNKRNQLLLAEAQTMGQTIGQQTAYKTEIALLNDVTEKQIPLSAAMYQEILKVAAAAGEAAQRAEDARIAWQGLNNAVQFAGNQLIDILDGLINKTTTWQDALKNLQQALLKAMLQAIILGQGPLGNILGLGATTPGGTGGIFGALLKGLTARQSGGPVGAGRPYIVGEHGPELFVPGSSGKIVPNQVSKSSTGTGLQVVVNNTVSQDTETTTRREQGPGIDRLVIDIVKRGMSGGQFDDVNQSRFGMRARKVR